MKHAEIHEILSKASVDAEAAFTYNDGLASHMRISRSGFPIVSTLLEDFVFSKLPELPQKVKTERQHNQDLVKQKMAQSTGYLFEQVVVDIFRQNPELNVQTQFKVQVDEFSGSCDIVLFNESKRHITVVECKALKYGTKTEACTKALYNDNATSYLSQLSLYKEALAEDYPDDKVDALWLVWCKATANLFKVPYSEASFDSSEIRKAADFKYSYYEKFREFFKAKDLDSCLRMLDLTTLPLKTPNYGYFEASCPAHYSRWIGLLLDEDGVAWVDSKNNLALMLETIFTKDKEAIDKLFYMV